MKSLLKVVKNILYSNQYFINLVLQLEEENCNFINGKYFLLKVHFSFLYILSMVHLSIIISTKNIRTLIG